MNIKKFVSWICSAAVIATNAAVISAPAALAEDIEEKEIGFFEDFEAYEEVSGDYSLVDAMNDLYANGWSVTSENAFTARDESDENQQFAQVVQDGDNKVLEISNVKTNSGLGRMLDPSTETPAGSYEITFKFKPVNLGDDVMLLDFSLNSFNEKNSIAKHNLLYSNKGTMRMGHRTNTIDVPMTRVGDAEEVWYDVKCVINNGGGYYSVELYKEGEFVARRGGINYDSEENIGFLKLSGYGKTVYVDDVSIRPCDPEMLIYEDNFDSYSEVQLPETMLTVGASVSETQSRNGDSFFEGYTPWRALKTFGNRYDLVYDKLIGSQVVELGDDVTTTAQESTGLILMPLDGDFLTKESQAKRGRLRLTYRFRHFSQNGYASTVDVIDDYRYSAKWDYPPQLAIQEKGLSRPAVAGLPYLRTNNTAVKINQSLWYDAEVIFDVINDEVTVIVREDSTGSEIANFKHNTNWINPDSAPVFEKIKAINFRAMTGSSVYIDDVRLEYYISNPEISGSNIIITDYRGGRVTDKKSVPTAIKSIVLPFGSEMTEESTNPETVTLTDSKGNNLSYSPVYDTNSYTILPNEFLNVGEEYILTVPASVANVFGLELGTDFSYSFTVTGEYPELMTLDSSSVSDLENIKNGADLTAEIDYANSLDAPLESMPFIAYYGDDMMLATSSVKTSSVGVGETGKKTVSFTVPSADVLDLSRVDKVSICLWKGFKNSAPYCAQIDIEGGGEELVFDTAQATEGTVSKPVIKYSYNDSILNISGTANEDDRFVTVQMLYPGKTFDMGEGDELVFYRAQTPVINGRYSLDVRFDNKGDAQSTLEAGYYPTTIYIGDKKMDTDSVYLGSYSNFEAVCNELNNAAASDDFAGFKNILNTKRAALNFNNELLGDTELGDEIRSYYTYVRNNPLNAKDEIKNSEIFDTYILMEYLNAAKIDSVADDIDTLVIADDLKTLCNKVLTTTEKDRYFTGLISRKALSDPAQLEKAIKEALILTAAKYGNGSGELQNVLVACGSVIGITAPISAAACKELIGKTFGDAATFKRAYDEYAASSGSSSYGGGGGGGGGGGSSSSSSGVPASKKPSIASVDTPVSAGSANKTEAAPVRKSFNDIDNYEWAMTGILALADRNIINGVAEDRYEPARNITREEFVKILVGALGASDHGYSGNQFVDASDDDWFVKHINIAAELGVVKGIGDGMFGTGQNITRQDMAVMLYNALQYRNVNMTTDGFKFDDDGQIADYAKPAVGALHAMGAINGVTETTFEPLGLATRAQAAKIIYSVLNELLG